MVFFAAGAFSGAVLHSLAFVDHLDKNHAQEVARPMESQAKDSTSTAKASVGTCTIADTKKASSFATKLSTTIESSARYFEGMRRRRLLRLSAENDLRAARTKLDTLLHISQAINPHQSDAPADCSPTNQSSLDESSGKRAAASPPKQTEKPRAIPPNPPGRTFSSYGGRIATKRQSQPFSSTENIGYPKINAVEPRPASASDLEPVLEIPNEKCACSPGISTERLEDDVDPSLGITCKEDAGGHTAALRDDRKESRVMDRRRPSSGRVLKKRGDTGRNRTFRSRLRAAAHPPTRQRKASNTPPLLATGETVGKNAETRDSTKPSSQQDPDTLDQTEDHGVHSEARDQISGASRMAFHEVTRGSRAEENEETRAINDHQKARRAGNGEDISVSIKEPVGQSSPERGEHLADGSVEEPEARLVEAAADCVRRGVAPSLLDTSKGDGLIIENTSLGALRAEVDGLRLEKGELVDTLAQLNVAAAQLNLVEYEQMKVRLERGALYSPPCRMRKTRFGMVNVWKNYFRCALSSTPDLREA